MPCYNCTLAGYCRLKSMEVLNQRDFKSSELIRAVRKTGLNLFEENNIKPKAAPDFLIDEYAKLEADNDDGKNVIKIINAAWIPAYIKTSILSAPDSIIDADKGYDWNEALRNYFRRTYFTTMADNITPYVSSDHRELFIVTGTLIGALKPLQSRLWPRAFGDNDNTPLLPIPANDN